MAIFNSFLYVYQRVFQQPASSWAQWPPGSRCCGARSLSARRTWSSGCCSCEVSCWRRPWTHGRLYGQATEMGRWMGRWWDKHMILYVFFDEFISSQDEWGIICDDFVWIFKFYVRFYRDNHGKIMGYSWVYPRKSLWLGHEDSERRIFQQTIFDTCLMPPEGYAKGPRPSVNEVNPHKASQ